MSGMELLLILAGVVGLVFYLIDEHTTQPRREVRPYYWPMHPQEPEPSGQDGTETQTE
jgi:hypothetical protein